MTLRVSDGPRRIVCLTEEPTEILYALGEQDRIVGISAYTERPPVAKQDKPVVSAFIGGSVDKIRALEPELVIGFSDIQADLARDLIKANLPVVIFNQRTLQEICDVVLAIGRLVDAGDRAEALVATYVANLERIRERAAALPRRPRVYFEEWDEPRISAIRWVSQLIELAGGDNVFADRAAEAGAVGRTVTDDEVLSAAPELVVGCWCGKPFDSDAFTGRAGYADLPAVGSGHVYEMDPAIILQPGPASLTDGVERLAELIHRSVR